MKERPVDSKRAVVADDQAPEVPEPAVELADSGRGSWVGLTRWVLPWLVPAFFTLYIKSRMLDAQGVDLATGYLGRVDWRDPQTRSVHFGLSFLERLSFYRNDLLVCFLLMPLALFFLCMFLPRRWRVPFTALLSGGVLIAMFIQLRGFEEVGQFLTLDMLVTALTWSLHEPKAYFVYVGLKGGSGLGLLAAGAFIYAVWRYRVRRKRNRNRRSPARRWRVLVELVLSSFFCCILVFLGLSWVARLQATSLHESVLSRAFRTFLDRGDVDFSEFTNLNAAQLKSRYQEIARVPSSLRDPNYWAKAKGCNVLFFVLETTPERFLPVGDSLEEFPNLRRLRARSFLALSHYTTFPNTQGAILSILSSWYPSSLRDTSRQHPDMAVPGMIRQLNQMGYETGLYSPYNLPRERVMLDSVGFQHQVYLDTRGSAGVNEADSQSDWGRVRIARDLATLKFAKEDLERWLTQGRRFAVMIAPAVGHLPYPDSFVSGQKGDIPKQGRPVLALQDKWLGEVLQLLDKYHQLERTIIVVTGDHGVRTNHEDPSLYGGMIDEYTFRVPLYIYVPMVLDQTRAIPWVTSHVDVAPTLLDLLGVEQDREFEQGTPLWNPDLAKRIIYFFGHLHLGADGYLSNGKFYMFNYLSESAYANSRLHFDAGNILPHDSPERLEVFRSIARMVALQEVWIAQFSQAKSLRNHIFRKTR